MLFVNTRGLDHNQYWALQSMHMIISTVIIDSQNEMSLAIYALGNFGTNIVKHYKACWNVNSLNIYTTLPQTLFINDKHYFIEHV